MKKQQKTKNTAVAAVFIQNSLIINPIAILR